MLRVRQLATRLRERVAQYRRRTVTGRETGESIDIGRLMCPLRYDIRIRIDFIRLLRDEAHVPAVDQLLDRPESRAYYIWFHEVLCARYRPRIYGHEALVWPAFLERVRETTLLWRSFERHGYDLSQPVSLRTGRNVRPVNGKAVRSTYFAGDGCHRLSCLYLAGQARLAPEQYQVEISPTFTPLDNTSVLFRHGAMDQAAYLRFLCDFYCDGLPRESAAEILRDVGNRRPEQLAEVESVLAFDLGGPPAHGER